MDKAWLLVVLGEERQYAGNLGYEDEPARVYRYDNFVQNYRRISAGDIVVLRNRHHALGLARVEYIEREKGKKERIRCPECATSKIRHRRSTLPHYICRSGHAFDTPSHDEVDCTRFSAHFGDSFVAATGKIGLDRLRSACPDFNEQLAMQPINLALLTDDLTENAMAAFVLLSTGTKGAYVQPADGDSRQLMDETPYEPGTASRRERTMRQILARRGQASFRDKLRQRYGERCVISGCSLVDVLEAAHIHPYREVHDQHPANGLLLRADLHTLFDLDLLGIEPESLTVSVHPCVARDGYEQLHGQRLQCQDRLPSKKALALRWREFQRRLPEGKH